MAAKKLNLILTLLWKNFKIKMKNPVGWVFEIIIPAIVIGLILLLVSVTPTTSMPNCNLKAKALPTASGMLFLQTFLCAAENACEDEKNASSESFKSSLLSDMGEALKGAFNIKPKRSLELDLNELSENLYVIDSLIEAIDNENKKWQLLYNSLLRSNIYSSASESENFHIKKLSRIKRNIHTTGVVKSYIRVLTEDQGFLSSLLNFLNLFLCGPDMKKIENQLMEITEELTSRSFKKDDDMSDDCINLIKFLEETPFNLALQFLRPLLLGKVVYTPDAPVINRIMERLGDSFKKIKDFLDMMKVANRAWTELRAWKLDEVINKYKNEDFLREAVKTKTSRALLERFKGKTNDDLLEGKPLQRKTDLYKKLLNKTKENYDTYLQQISPKIEILDLISVLECIDFNKFIAVKSEGDAMAKALELLENERLWSYVVFTNVPAGAENLPPSVTYKMRMSGERSPNTLYEANMINLTGPVRAPISGAKEVQGGIVHLQNMIEGELIREYTGRKDVPGFYLNQLPYPCFKMDGFQQYGFEILKSMFGFAFMNLYIRIVKRIVLEKEVLFREILRIFGVTNAHHWIAFFIEAFITGFISVLIVCVVLKAFLGYFAVFFVLLLAFIISIIGLAFLVSTFLSKSSFSTILASVIFLFLLVFNSLVSETTSMAARFFLCFISTSALMYGAAWISNMLLSNVPITIEVITYSPEAGGSLNFLLVIFMLLIDAVIYIALAVYFENIISTKAVRKPWNYCFKASYWKNCCKKSEPLVESPEPGTTRSRKKEDSKNFEAEPNGQIGIEVINVSKEFGRSKNKIRVVNNLSINFYENQITSFLGHNGAGKSTTVLMMTGVISPTSGTIRIYGIDLQKNPEAALKNVGICFQENVFIGELSVRDHLVLIGRLKGLSKKEIKTNINQLLEDFEFSSRAHQPVKQLSGGWKRKVCIAMAFMGGSRTIFLDEPTAGIDPFARRSVWDLLVKLKKGRTMVLITHHLDEADILGDRIAIIASGELKCCGSSSFLKSNLDKGYTLTVDTTVRSEKTSSKKNKKVKKQMSPETQELVNLVKSSIHGADLEEERGSEVIFSLPQKQSSSDFNRLFEALERNKSKLKINTYGVSAVSLEEVFMKVLMKAEAEENDGKNEGGTSSQKSTSRGSEGPKSTQDSKEALRNSSLVLGENDVEKSEDRQISKESLEITSKSPKMSAVPEMKQIITLRQRDKLQARHKFWNHFSAIWLKQIQHYRRNYIFLILQILLPLCFTFLGIISITLALPKLPSVTVDVSDYDSSVLFYTNNFPANSHLSSYEDALLGPYGLGTKCILSPEKCSLKSIEKGSMVAEGETIASNKCTCEDGDFKCEGNATAEPPEAEMSTGHRLFNMTGLDLNNWLLATEYKYSIKRIGGITFGHISPLVGVSIGDFLSLISEKNLLNILDKYIINGQKQIDAKQFTSDIMSGLNKSFGTELFQDKDPTDNIIIWFNSRDTIASMAMINGVSNLVLRSSLPAEEDPSQYSIRLIVHPFPITAYSTGAQKLFQSLTGIIMNFIQALAFFFALIMFHLVEERVCGIKQMAFISGINPLVYWCAYFLWDILIFTVLFILLILLIFICNVTWFCGANTLPVFSAALYSYALTNLIFLYLTSNFFSFPSSGIIFVIIWMAVVGGLSFLITAIFASARKFQTLLQILLLVPECCLGKCLLNLAMENSQNVASSTVNYFKWDLTTQYIIRILINGGVYLILLAMFEFRNVQPLGSISKCCSSLKLLCRRSTVENEDEDVVAEKERVRSNKAKEEGDLLIVKNLTKIYCGQRNPAASHIYVGVKPGECLGLLGMNGAGKTTIFKMLSGNTTPTLGDATIAGFSMTYNSINSRVLIGYCPQMNALDPYLTPIEHLAYFCRIRGYNKIRRNKETDTLIELLGLSKHKNKISKALSGGNKRKLNAAIALLSEPELVLLDEPTAGMDVLARRFLWSRLLEVLQDGRCLVLTTHSMEECQALATQVCIMYRGKFACFGSSQHLKNKFNEGYSVIMRLMSDEKYNDIINYFNENLPGYTVVRSHTLHLKIRLHPDTNIGKAVNILGEIKRRQWIEDYSVNQTTLESVFLKLVGEADREHAFSKPCCSC